MDASRAPVSEGLSRIFWHLFRIVVSLSLLFVDNTVLLGTALLAYVRSIPRRWQTKQADVHFYPKTILITGIGTPHGLALARAGDADGHRVVGVDVADLDLPVRSGGSMSTTLRAFYRVPKDHYISRILDIVHREKVDLWIPCSPKATAVEDATAREVVERRTGCKCIAFDPEWTDCLVHADSFRQFLVERGLPVVECHQVQSRDSIHKILHRSPAKLYQIQRLKPGANETAVILPKRTLSKTYSEVSEIQISKDSPWVLQQQTRLGEFFADLLVVRGHVHAIKVRLAEARSTHWGASRLDEALAMAIHRLMQDLAAKGGARMTGHLSVRLLVDEECDRSSVRHTIHIADCVPGAVAAENLLRDARSPISGYLALLSPELTEPAAGDVTATLSPSPHSRPSILHHEAVVDLLPRFLFPGLVKAVATRLEAELAPFFFWAEPRFSYDDPLPWWWHTHVYQPLREVWLMMKQTREAGLTSGPF
ncbi:uncharacterized protein N7459_007997 [Penicillium hispanicum]|uniref:uncharacterized protein n=1 Tax=Penicillium hispanicum TaxID=1080232 RepID=UPI002540E33C|nr:uncharacterized protein N7459_007997 [Penicillium hispanicum]KAJ5573570.1 hypothetical protein N7459_007997 [Penicillium hispanicum]